ncbi:glycosyltransferase [Bombella sp. TMW2.1889]|uniref:Glycosyltransferase n=2 Tax=Bombella mellum TaxID=2039288 RepID=A0ABR5ZT68_9PROT|nr:glycosyltransferase [Bombella mellum]
MEEGGVMAGTEQDGEAVMETGQTDRNVLTPQALSACCQQLFASGEGEQAVRLAVQAAEASRDVSILLAAGLFLARCSSRHDVTVAVFRKALLLRPSTHPAMASVRGEIKVFLAGALMAAGQNEEAMALFMEVAQTCPEHRVLVGEHLSMALLEAGLADQAEQVLAAWLKDGSSSVSLYNNMGCALERLNRSREALPYYRKGMELSSRHEAVSFGYAIALLKAGDYEEGFARYVRRIPRMPSLDCWFYQDLPRLTKDVPLEGRHILFYQEQGLGDTIQFIRFLPEIVRRAGRVTLAVLPSLARLLRESYPMVQVCLMSDLLEQPEQVADYDFSCPIPDLPYLCDLKRPEDVPPFSPYLEVPVRRRENFAQLVEAAVFRNGSGGDRSHSGRRLRVGLVWAGDSRSSVQDVAADRRRSSSFAEMMEAIGPVEADLFSLQYGVRRAELGGAGAPVVHDLMESVQDMADTAALMESLDVVISVDTAPLHLAGALGREVWLVSRWDACWRWGDQGERTPWYPTMRIFRAQELSLGPVLREVGHCLRQRVAEG